MQAASEPDMVLSELAVRLNCAEYKNWVKAGHCLLLLCRCLQGFIGREVLSFHRGLLAARGLGLCASCSALALASFSLSARRAQSGNWRF
jgi:hypothetical protein